MPRFIVTRSLPPLSENDLKALPRKVTRAADELGLTWIRSHVTADGKHSFCEFEAANADLCREHSKKVGLPFDKILSIGVEMNGRDPARKVS